MLPCHNPLYSLHIFRFTACLTACSNLLNHGQISLPLDTEYIHLFIEKKSPHTIYHPFNAYSSLIYFSVFCNHLQSDNKVKALIAWINLTLSVFSFLYHSTEIEIIGNMDLGLVICNTLAMFFFQTDVNAALSVSMVCGCVLVMMLVMMIDNVAKYNSPRIVLVNKYKYPFIAMCSFAILLTKKGSSYPYFIFVLGYVFKITEVILVSRNVSIPFQGTCMYHLLTGSAMLLKLKDPAHN